MRVSATEEPESPQEGTDGAWPVLRPRYVDGAAIPQRQHLSLSGRNHQGQNVTPAGLSRRPALRYGPSEGLGFDERRQVAAMRRVRSRTWPLLSVARAMCWGHLTTQNTSGREEVWRARGRCRVGVYASWASGSGQPVVRLEFRIALIDTLASGLRAQTDMSSIQAKARARSELLAAPGLSTARTSGRRGGVDLRALPGEHPQAHAAGRQGPARC